jgi:hypothetical protein
MNTTASTVGAYCDLPPDRRVAMARLCSMIRRSARGCASMRYAGSRSTNWTGLVRVGIRPPSLSLYVAEKDVVLKHKDALQGVNAAKSFIKFSDLNRLPLDVVEKIGAGLGRCAPPAAGAGNGSDAERTPETLGH